MGFINFEKARPRAPQAHPQLWELPPLYDDTDDRALEMEQFLALHRRFRFTVDAAASRDNARLERYWTKDDDALTQSWAGERIWCNPPYSNIGPWVAKAHAETEAELVVLLLPANRTEQPWWQTHVEPFRDGRRPGSCSVEFLAGRQHFLRPGERRWQAHDRPLFGCCLIIWGEG